MTESPRCRARRCSRDGIWPPLVAIALVIAVLTLHRLGAGDVCSGNEAVEGVFVQQMVEHGQLLFPIENGSVADVQAAAISLDRGRDRSPRPESVR